MNTAQLFNIGKSTVVIVSLTALVVGSSIAFFSDQESSTNNLFSAGSIDLKVGNESYYNGQLSNTTSWQPTDLENELFFNFGDVKPGDWGEDTISLQVNTNDAWACFDMTLTKNDDVSSTANELTAGDTANDVDNAFDGELAQALQFLFWADDGDNVLEDDENDALIMQGNADTVLDASVTLADSSDNNIDNSTADGDPLEGSTTYYMAKAWCFGSLAQTPVAQDGVGDGSINNPTIDPGITCDGSSVNNITQTDTIMADISFYAEQARHNETFVCPECEKGENVWGFSVASFSQGLRKDGSPVLANRSIPNNTLGAPQGLVNPPKWYSLGFGGSVTVAYEHPIIDVPGVDVSIHEITGGRPTYPVELASVQVSQNGTTFQSIGTASSLPDGVDYFDFSPTGYEWIKYIRVTDTTNPAIHTNDADGFDLDAVDGVKFDSCADN